MRIQAGRGPDKTPRRVLADVDVRYVGDPIVIVVAESRYLAEDAAELVMVDIEPDDAVVTMPQALAEDAPLVHRELPDNLAGVLPAGDHPEADALLENAPHVFHETFNQHRYVNVPMETRGLVVEWDTATKQIEVVFACQGVHEPRAALSRLLDIPADEIHVVMGDVGGSFGQKISIGREEQAVVVAAMIIGNRPVKWIEDRAENLIGGGHAREEWLEVTAATDENGLFLAARANHVENSGAYPSGSNGQTAGLASASSPGRITGPGPVRWPTAARPCTPTPAGTARTAGRG